MYKTSFIILIFIYITSYAYKTRNEQIMQKFAIITVKYAK